MNEEYESLRAQPTTEAPKKPMTDEQKEALTLAKDCLGPALSKFGTMFLEIIEMETANDPPILKFYVLAELLKDKYNVSLEELLDPSYLPQRKQCLLDMAITSVRKNLAKKWHKDTLVPVHERLNIPSSDSLRLFNHRIINGRQTGIVYVGNKNDSLPDMPQGLLDLFATEIKESKKSSVTLKLTDLQKKTGVKISTYIGAKKGEKLSTVEERMRFNTWLREACARMNGLIEGRPRLYAVMEFDNADLNCEYVTYSSPYYSEIYGIIENGDKKLPGAKNLTNNLVRTKANSLKTPYAYEALVGITNLIKKRGLSPDEKRKNNREELTAGDPTAVSCSITWLSFLEDYCPDAYNHIRDLPKNNRNTFLERLCKRVFKRDDGKKPALLDPNYCGLTEDYEGPFLVKTTAPTWSVLATTWIVIVHHGRKKKRG